jgi:hypothetical protein
MNSREEGYEAYDQGRHSMMIELAMAAAMRLEVVLDQVRFGSKGDTPGAPPDVRFTPESEHPHL